MKRVLLLTLLMTADSAVSRPPLIPDFLSTCGPRTQTFHRIAYDLSGAPDFAAARLLNAETGVELGASVRSFLREDSRIFETSVSGDLDARIFQVELIDDFGNSSFSDEMVIETGCSSLKVDDGFSFSAFLSLGLLVMLRRRGTTRSQES